MARCPFSSSIGLFSMSSSINGGLDGSFIICVLVQQGIKVDSPGLYCFFDAVSHGSILLLNVHRQLLMIFLLTWSGGVISSDSLCHKSLTLGNVHKSPFVLMITFLIAYS